MVMPRLKKSGLDPAEIKNYRPISNLPFMSKVIEKLILAQLTQYLTENGLLSLYHHSCLESREWRKWRYWEWRSAMICQSLSISTHRSSLAHRLCTLSKYLEPMAWIQGTYTKSSDLSSSEKSHMHLRHGGVTLTPKIKSVSRVSCVKVNIMDSNRKILPPSQLCVMQRMIDWCGP